MKKVLLALGAVCIYFAFLPALALVWLSVLFHLALRWDVERTSVVFNSINRAVSTLFGGDGTRSTSHTSGVKLVLGTADWRHKCLCASLDVFDENHCVDEAQDDPLVIAHKQ